MSEKPCDRCRLLFCDFISKDCRLTPAEVAEQRPDLLRPTPINRPAHRWQRRDGIRRDEQIQSDISRPMSVFARIRVRRLERV